jgi:hypothetical protein
MSATIFTLKGFVIGFTTGGVSYKRDMSVSAGGSGSSDSYELWSFFKVTTKAKLLPQDYTQMELRVTSVQQTPTSVSSRVDEIPMGRSRGNDDENESITSFNSLRIMMEQNFETSRS